MTRNCHVPFCRAVGEATLLLTLILSQWDGFSCDLNLQKDASVMDSSGLNHGVLGTPPNSVKPNQTEYIQLSLFDWTRYENPTLRA
ncbi:hypothetical protein [Planktothrix mougeotii]|uniref:Uncharacterized protein n=1 Tax=Planktothrix mougeotii LEGE 06226 TaxID=1828728 RepID=A0ABR9UIT0_9CYAN|nr:hypothetical protein [Planktothrix mougeotii]MBE9146066.1 hypothetical protein [Planktothrix mougeotii LEGE 06226]